MFNFLLNKKEQRRAEEQARDARQDAAQARNQATKAQQDCEQMKNKASVAEKDREQMREKASVAEKNLEQMRNKASVAEKDREQMRNKARKAEIEREQERYRANDLEEKAAEARQEAKKIKQEADRIKQEVELKKKKEEHLKEQFRWGPKKDVKWSAEECERYRKKFQEELNTSKGHTFLLFGPTTHGKSSVGNGFISAVQDRELPSTYHHVAQSAESVSRAFKTKNYKLHRIIDMPGIFEGKSIKDEDIRKIVTGQVPWVSKVTTNLETPDNKTAHNDTVECIIIVLRYDMTEIPPELKRQIGVIWSLCGADVLSCRLILTHLDVCDPQFKNSDNLPNIFKSAKVLKAVETMSKATGLPPLNISFVKNYTTEQETDVNSKLQYLRILDAVVSSADEVVEARMTKASMTEDYRQQSETEARMTEDYRQQSGTKARMTEDYRQQSETKASMTEDYRQQSETKASMTEDYRQQSETKGRMTEDNRQQSETKARMTEDNRQGLDRVMTYNEFLFLIGVVLVAILFAYFSLF